MTEQKSEAAQANGDLTTARQATNSAELPAAASPHDESSLSERVFGTLAAQAGIDDWRMLAVALDNKLSSMTAECDRLREELAEARAALAVAVAHAEDSAALVESARSSMTAPEPAAWGVECEYEERGITVHRIDLFDTEERAKRYQTDCGGAITPLYRALPSATTAHKASGLFAAASYLQTTTLAIEGHDPYKVAEAQEYFAKQLLRKAAEAQAAEMVPAEEGTTK